MEFSKSNILQEYENYLVVKHFAQETKRMYLSEANKLLEYIDDLSSISLEVITAYMYQYGGCTKATRNSHASSLRVFLKYLHVNSYIDAEPRIPYIKEERKLPRILSPEELIKRFNITKKRAIAFDDWQLKRNYALLMLMYATGMRIGEVMQFSMANIDKNWIRVENGKGGKDRYVPVADEALKALDDYIYSCPFSFQKSFFVDDTGKPMDKTFAREIVRKSVGLLPHDLRHHFATHLIMNKCDVSIVSEFLGHSSLQTTQIYTHIQNPQLQQTVIECHPMAEGKIYAI